MWHAALSLALVGYLPGALLFRLPVLDRARRAGLAADERAYWACLLSGAWSLLVAFALAAAGRYRFTWLLAANAAAILALLAVGRGRLRLGSAPRPDLHAIVPAALVLGSLWLLSAPSEYVIGGKDPGVYMNEGIQIAQRGTLTPDDQVVAAVPAWARDLFFPAHGVEAYHGVRFMGFFITDPDAGRVVGQFPHLYPTAIALGYGVFGLTGARYAVAACAIAGLLGVYFLAVRLAGRAVGAAAASLLAVHVVQVWFGRYPNSEMIAQALLFGGLLAFARAHVDDDPFFAPVAGMLLAALLLARFDALVTLALVAGAAALLLLDGRRPRWAFVSTLAAMGLAGATYLLTVMTPYLVRPRMWAEQRVPWLLAVPVVLGLAFVAMRWIARHERAADRLRDAVPSVLAVLVAAAAVYAYFLRAPGGRLAPHDAYAFRTYAWYVPPAALAGAVVGFGLLARRAFWRDPAFFVVAAGSAVFFFQRMYIVPEHFWASRRWVPLVLPATVIALSSLIFTGTGRRPPRTTSGGWGRTSSALLWSGRALLRMVLFALVAASFVGATRPVLAHVEYAGVIPRLEQLASRFTERDLVIVESRNASDAHVLAVPLAYIYARQVLVLNSPKPDRATFARFTTDAWRRYDRVFFLGGGGTDLLSRAVGVEPVVSERFQVPEYESPRNAYPTRARMKEFDFGIYRLVPDGTPTAGIALELGHADDLHVVRFHAKERDDRGTYRWTRDVSYVALLGLTPSTRTLTIWMENGGRPLQAGAATVDVSIEDRAIGRVTVGSAREAFSFALPDDLLARSAQSNAPALLKLVSATWNPRAVLGVDDGRDLGVRVSRIEVR